MKAKCAPSRVSTFSEQLKQLKADRYREVAERRSEVGKRKSLSKAERQAVLRKTGNRCHICGGRIRGNDWHADHVSAHSTGGEHAVDNYLPSCTVCNNYRWYYGPEEFQWILKLGVWLRRHIEEQTPIGKEAGQHFCDYDRLRAARTKGSRSRSN